MFESVWLVIVSIAMLAEADGKFILSYTKIPGNATDVRTDATGESGLKPEDVIEWSAWLLFITCSSILVYKIMRMRRVS